MIQSDFFDQGVEGFGVVILGIRSSTEQSVCGASGFGGTRPGRAHNSHIVIKKTRLDNVDYIKWKFADRCAWYVSVFNARILCIEHVNWYVPPNF